MHVANVSQDSREARIREMGDRLLAARTRPARWQAGFAHLLDAYLTDAELRVQALRFVDVLPALRDDAQLSEHFQAYFGAIEPARRPASLRWALDGLEHPVSAYLSCRAIHRLARRVARRFVAGEDLPQVLERVLALRAEGMDATLDLLGEATLSESEALDYLERYRRIITHAAARLRPARGETKGPLLHCAIKLSSLYSQISAVSTRHSQAVLQERLAELARVARREGVLLMLDMEHYESRHIVLAAFRGLLEQPEFRDWPHVGIALQAYLRDTEQDLLGLLEWVRRRGTPICVRLVRGAYWDAETAIAGQQGWPLPVWRHKAHTDQCYERCLEHLFAAARWVRPAPGTHNLRSLALSLVLAREQALDSDDFELQMLCGMAEGLHRAVRAQDCRLRIYMPFGELIPGMAYLVRRLLENSSSQSMLRGLDEAAFDRSLLNAPSPPTDAEAPRDDTSGFRNLPLRRFTDADERQAFGAALQRVRGELGQAYPLPDLPPQAPRPCIHSLNPARPQQLVGAVEAAGKEDVDGAVRRAEQAFPEWSAMGFTARAERLDAAAQLLEARRDELAAWELFEAGKSWSEADADVAEAVDFLRYYAAEARRLAMARRRPYPGEDNRLHYRPMGVGVLLPPWNFPLAIPVGMLAGAIAAGNTVILKPASATPVVAHQLCRLLRDSGLPDGVVNLLPGEGDSVGEALVRHPRIHFIAFTGSRAVGLRINQLAAESWPGQRHVKRLIAEMGGKNAIIVDSDADLDEAVLGVTASAFGFQGQKCSACSRVIVVGDAYAPFLKRLTEAVRSLAQGSPEDPANVLGPVIDAAARERLRRQVERGRGEATLVPLGRDLPADDGYWVAPAVFTEVPADSFLAREELFGPLLSVLRTENFDQAVELANATDYALTGGVYSRHPGHLAVARERLEVGNLYLNRRITRAMVDRQPFGGYRLSGMGYKAGGPAYLLQFMHECSVTENTLRRGFAPD